MKFKSSPDNKKHWEKIKLDEIQPYPSRYNKAIIIAYLFAFSALFIKFMSVNSILDPFIPFIKLSERNLRLCYPESCGPRLHKIHG